MNDLTSFDKLFQEAQYPIDLFEKYFDYQDKFLSKEINDLSEIFKNQTKDMDYPEQIHYENLYNEFHFNFLNGTFPDMQNKATLILLYNTFDNNLKLLCDLLEKTLNIPISRNELKGSDLVKSRTFLVKLCGLNENVFKSAVWHDIDFFRQLRNCIVHNSSNISSLFKSQKNTIERFKKFDGFETDGIYFGLLKNDFLREIMKTISAFYQTLQDELKNNHRINLN